MKARKAVFVVLLVIAVVTISALARLSFRQWDSTSECVQNMQTICAALKQYAADSRDFYPSLSPVPGQMMFSPDLMYPKYLKDASCLISLSLAYREETIHAAGENPQSLIDDSNYWYLGWAFGNDQSAFEWIGQYVQHVASDEPISPEISTRPEYEARIAQFRAEARQAYEADPQRYPKGIYVYEPWMDESMRIYVPLQVGVERVFCTDVGNPGEPLYKQSKIPVMIERPIVHRNGGHVLYLDGHVEFVPYPGKFPMEPEFIEALQSLDYLSLDDFRRRLYPQPDLR